MLFWIVLAHVVVLAMLPGAVAGTAVGWLRGRLGAGLGSGTVGGMVGGAIGFVLYLLYRSSLPYVELPGELGLRHHIIDPPPWYVGCLCVFGGSLIFAILLAAVFVRRPTAPTSKEPGRKRERTRDG
jgi:hypothetical protein